jgi:hypothetical protein
MRSRWVLVPFAVGIGALAPAALWAQQQRSPFPDPYDPKTYSEELTPGQIQRAQEPDTEQAVNPPARAVPKQPPAPPRAVACSGAFAKDSSHLKLASVYKSENVVFMEVDVSDGKKMMASVLFPKDPKRRLEVWWQNEASRTGTYLIVINGKSTWTAPKGLRIGLQLPALEKLNGKPFKLKGFDGNSAGSVSDWQGGALASLTGGCKVGAFLRPDPKSTPEVRGAVVASTEYVSTDGSVKAVKPVVSEIIIGY